MLTRDDIQALILSAFTGELTEVCEQPIWAIQRAEHPAFERMAAAVPTHLTPAKILAHREAGTPDHWSVLAIAFPRTEAIVAEIAATSDLPPESWFSSKIVKTRELPVCGERLAQRFRGAGVDAFVAPGKELFCVAANEAGTAFENTWSERHVGYACGLGTFGLHGGLITNAGCTHRLISLMLRARVSDYDSVNENPFGNCLYHARGTCGACIKRCPAGAVSAGGHDAMRCRQQAYVTNRERVRKQYGLDMPGCALCLSAVPCSRENPMGPTSPDHEATVNRC